MLPILAVEANVEIVASESWLLDGQSQASSSKTKGGSSGSSSGSGSGSGTRRECQCGWDSS